MSQINARQAACLTGHAMYLNHCWLPALASIFGVVFHGNAPLRIVFVVGDERKDCFNWAIDGDLGDGFNHLHGLSGTVDEMLVLLESDKAELNTRPQSLRARHSLT